MTDIGALVRIFEPNTTDDLVDKRKIAIGAIKDKLKATTKAAISLSYANALAEGLATGILPEPLFTEVGDAIQRESSAFEREKHVMEMIVCTVGAAHILAEEAKPSTSGWSTTETLLGGILSASSVLKPHEGAKLDTWVQSLISLAAGAVERAADSSRRRQTVPEFSIAISDGESGAALSTKIKGAFNKVLNPALINAQMDREELDLLWWSMGNWSDLIEQKISSLPAPLALVISALEVAYRLRRVPAVAHSHIAMRHNMNPQTFSLSQIKDAVAPHRDRLMAQMADISVVTAYPRVFPFLNNVFLDVATEDFSIDSFAWCQRIVLEGGLTTKLTQRVSV